MKVPLAQELTHMELTLSVMGQIVSILGFAAIQPQLCHYHTNEAIDSI